MPSIQVGLKGIEEMDIERHGVPSMMGNIGSLGPLHPSRRSPYDISSPQCDQGFFTGRKDGSGDIYSNQTLRGCPLRI
jgi:hypothetical protein